MIYENLKIEFIKLKKEELEYIDNVFKKNKNRILSEFEKLEIYRALNNYTVKLNELLKQIRKELFKSKEISAENPDDIIFEFNIDKDYLTCIDGYHKERIFDCLGIDAKTLKFKLYLHNIYRAAYGGVSCNNILINQRLIENPIYICNGYWDYSEDCIGPCFGNPEDYIYGIYEDIRDIYIKEEIPKKKINDFEKGKTIIHSKRYVDSREIRKIFEEELLNNNNKSINDCIIETRKRIEELNYTRSPEYKEKVLLDKINELYKKVKGKFIKKEVLYNGVFLEVLRETYKLPNDKIVTKEKITKNGGKNSVIIIAITQDNEYIITFQNRIKDEKIAEFPSGYIENGEDPIEAAKRELQEETGYISDDLFIVDEAFASPGIDNSVSYIIIANNCIKSDKIKSDGTELVKYGLFSEIEVKYLISENIMKGAINKLAYYNLIYNLEDYNVSYVNSNKKIYKRQRKKYNPFIN